jgi:hypothetical protein
VNEARTTFDRLLADEPPLTLALGPVRAAGLRARRRRRAAYGSALACLAVSVAVVAVPLARRDGGRRLVAASPPAAGTAQGAFTARQRAMFDAVVGASPDGWSLVLRADNVDANAIMGTTDDGGGVPAFLHVAVDAPTHPATAPVHICTKMPRSVWAPGAVCTEEVQPDGSVLSLYRVEDGDRRCASAFVNRADGSAVKADSGRWTRASDPALSRVAGALDCAPVPGAAAYAPERLGAVALAVARALLG